MADSQSINTLRQAHPHAPYIPDDDLDALANFPFQPALPQNPQVHFAVKYFPYPFPLQGREVAANLPRLTPAEQKSCFNRLLALFILGVAAIYGPPCLLFWGLPFFIPGGLPSAQF